MLLYSVVFCKYKATSVDYEYSFTPCGFIHLIIFIRVLDVSFISNIGSYIQHGE